MIGDAVPGGAAPPRPPDEAARLADLRALGAIGRGSDPELDSLADLAALVAGSGATLAFAAGGAGEFNASQISDLLANLTSATNNNNGLLAGSRFGLSVDSALTLTNPVVDSTGTGGGACGLSISGRDEHSGTPLS